MENKACKICGYEDVPDGKEICEFCENAKASISDVGMRKSVSVDLHKFCSIFSKEGDNMSLTRDELEAIYNALVKLGMEFTQYK